MNIVNNLSFLYTKLVEFNAELYTNSVELKSQKPPNLNV